MATDDFSPSFGGPSLHDLVVEIFTNTHVVRGTVPTRQRRLSDVLNEAENDFIILSHAEMTEFGSTKGPVHAEFAQVNLATVLFVVSEVAVEPLPEMRLQKLSERALIVVPPFQIAGSIHVLPDRDLRQALSELVGRFIPITNAEFWSDTTNVPRTRAPMLAFNRRRAHVLASHDATLSSGAPQQDR